MKNMVRMCTRRNCCEFDTPGTVEFRTLYTRLPTERLAKELVDQLRQDDEDSCFDVVATESGYRFSYGQGNERYDASYDVIDENDVPESARIEDSVPTDFPYGVSEELWTPEWGPYPSVGPADGCDLPF